MDWGRARTRQGYQVGGDDGLEKAGGGSKMSSRDRFQRYLEWVIDWFWR